MNELDILKSMVDKAYNDCYSDPIAETIDEKDRKIYELLSYILQKKLEDGGYATITLRDESAGIAFGIDWTGIRTAEGKSTFIFKHILDIYQQYSEEYDPEILRTAIDDPEMLEIKIIKELQKEDIDPRYYGRLEVYQRYHEENDECK